MSIFGKIGHGLKAVGGAVGDVAKRAAPLATFIPGVGPVAAGIIGVGGGLLGKLNDQNVTLGGTLKDAAIGGATGYGGARLLDRFLPNQTGNGIPGVGGMSGPTMHQGPGGIQWADPNTLGHINQPQSGGLGGTIGGVGKLIFGQNAGQNGLLPLALGLAGTFQNAQQATKAGQLTDQQIQQANEAIARQRMLQDQVLANLKNPVATPDYTNIFAQTQNPFYRPQAVQMGT